MKISLCQAHLQEILTRGSKQVAMGLLEDMYIATKTDDLETFCEALFILTMKVGEDAAWELLPATPEDGFDFDYVEGALDPAGRLTLELIPFSQYK